MIIDGNATISADSTVIDSAIANLEYITSSGIHGFTDENGEFRVNMGDRVTFKIGDIVLGEVDPFSTGDGRVFLQDIAGVDRSDINDTYVRNMAVLLQTLDSDGNANNGIEISNSLSEDIDIKSIDTKDLIDILKSEGYSVVDPQEALEHVRDTLIDYTDLDSQDFENIENLKEPLIVENDTINLSVLSDDTAVASDSSDSEADAPTLSDVIVDAPSSDSSDSSIVSDSGDIIIDIPSSDSLDTTSSSDSSSVAVISDTSSDSTSSSSDSSPADTSSSVSYDSDPTVAVTVSDDYTAQAV